MHKLFFSKPLDANIPYSVKEVLEIKHKVFHVRDINLSHADDNQIIAWSKKNQAILITKDLDFANILNFPSFKYFGIVILRVPSHYIAIEIKKVVQDFINNFDLKNVEQSTIIVEEGKIRIRKQ